MVPQQLFYKALFFSKKDAKDLLIPEPGSDHFF